MKGIDGKIPLYSFGMCASDNHIKLGRTNISAKNLAKKVAFSWKVPAFAPVAA